MSADESLNLAPFDAADYLNSPEDVVEYLRAVLAERDADYLLKALATIARSPAMKIIEHLAESDDRRGPDKRSADLNLSLIGQIAATIGAGSTANAR